MSHDSVNKINFNGFESLSNIQRKKNSFPKKKNKKKKYKILKDKI